MPSMLDIAKGIRGKSAERLTRQAAGVTDSRSKTRYGTVVSYDSTENTIVASIDGGGETVTLQTETAASAGDRVTVIIEGGVWKVLNIKHVQNTAESAASDASTALDTAESAASDASLALQTATTTQGNLETAVSDINTAISAINQFFWHDTNGCHVATTAGQAAATTNSLWNSNGIYFRKGLNYLVTLLSSGLTFFDGSGNNEANITAQFAPDAIYLGKGNNSSTINMCGGKFKIYTEVTNGFAQGFLEASNGVFLRPPGATSTALGIMGEQPSGGTWSTNQIIGIAPGIMFQAGAGGIDISSPLAITKINGTSVRTSSTMMHKGAGVYLDASNLTDKTVPSSQTNGDANLYFRDSENTTLAFFGQTFQPDGRQGVRFYTNRTPQGGSSTTNGCALYVDSDGKRITTFNSATPWRYALRVGYCNVKLASNAASSTSNAKVTMSGNITTDTDLLTAASGGIKCVVAGTIKVSASLYCSGMTGTGGLAMLIRKNSTTMVESISPVSGGLAQNSICGYCFTVSANDIIYVYGRSTTAGTYQKDACFLTVEYIS